VVYGGQWPEQVPAELRLVAGGSAGQGRSSLLATGPAGRGTLTVTLPPGQRGAAAAQPKSTAQPPVDLGIR
jgi:hypothetical protein